jgi:patatin-like phospholipase/acyl hydrolase
MFLNRNISNFSKNNQKLAIQRGENLSALSLKSEELTQAATEFAKTSREIANKFKKSNKFF